MVLVAGVIQIVLITVLKFPGSGYEMFNIASCHDGNPNNSHTQSHKLSAAGKTTPLLEHEANHSCCGQAKVAPHLLTWD